MNLIKKMIVKRKINNLYYDMKEACFKTANDWRNNKITETSAICVYKGIARYATVRYKHIFESYGINNADAKNDARFEEMISDIEETINNMQSSF